MKRASSIMMSILLLASMLAVSFTTRNVEATGTVYIRADCSIDPPAAPIRQDSDFTAQSSVDWWPMYQHDPRHIGFSTSKAPISSRIDWNCTLPKYLGFNDLDGIGLAVADDIVFACTQGNSGPGLPPGRVYALDATLGEEIWSFTAYGGMSYIAGFDRPAIADGIVVVPSYECYLYGLNETSGATLWSYYDYHAWNFGPPAMTDGMVFTGESGRDCVHAFNQTTGQEIWRYDTGAAVGPPAVADGMVFAPVYAGNGIIYALNETSGEQLWNTIVAEKHATIASVEDGIVFAGATTYTGGSTVYALNETNGKQIWNCTVGAYPRSIAVAYGRVFVGVGDYNKVATLYALNEATGSLYWTKTGIVGYTSICVADNKLFWDKGQQGLMCLNTLTGNTVWSVQGEWNDVVIADNAVYALQVLRSGDYRQAAVVRFADAHDVATTNVNPDKTTIVKDIGSQEVIMEVTVENQGSFTEDFNVTAYANTTQVDKKTVTNLNLGASRVLSFTWDTSGFDLGNYTLSAVADVVTNETDTLDNTYIDGVVKVRLPIHGVAVTDVTPSKTVVGQGYNTSIDVTAANQGDYTETFNVTAYANATTIETKEITLTIGNSTILTFTWNTTDFTKGNYTISAYAEPVPGETDTADNNRTDGSILITKVGDLGGGVPPAFFNCDDSVDGKDLALFLQCYKGTAPAEAMYLGDLGGGVPPQFYDCDGNVDGKDLALFLLCYKGLGP
jgi:outer membrane protein assembly factor BamB